MIGNSTVLAGNLTADPSLNYTNTTGTPVVSFTLATTERTYDRATGEWKDGDTLFIRCTAWKNAGAENVAASLTKGARVIVTGKLGQRTFTGKDGQQRTVIELGVEEIGASLKYATAQLTKSPASHHQASSQSSAPAPGYAPQTPTPDYSAI